MCTCTTAQGCLSSGRRAVGSPVRPVGVARDIAPQTFTCVVEAAESSRSPLGFCREFEHTGSGAASPSTRPMRGGSRLNSDESPHMIQGEALPARSRFADRRYFDKDQGTRTCLRR
jgi:hypothetical protein